jgi:hypothetical protein
MTDIDLEAAVTDPHTGDLLDDWDDILRHIAQAETNPLWRSLGIVLTRQRTIMAREDEEDPERGDLAGRTHARAMLTAVLGLPKLAQNAAGNIRSAR